MRKVCVVITARPSYARIKSVLASIDAHPNLHLQLVVSASALLERYGSTIDYIRADGYEPDEVVYMLLEGENFVTAAKSTGLGIVELATVFDNLEPDVVITIADRYETIATAIAAAYSNIPVAHVQGGEVSGSIDEKVRHAVTKLSDLHLVSNTNSAERVRKMGEDPKTVFVTGCPSIDLAADLFRQPEQSLSSIESLHKGLGTPFDPLGDYLVVLHHPVTTEYQDAFDQIYCLLDAISSLRIPTFWFWPNVDAGSDRISKGIRMFRENNDAQSIYFLKNTAPESFLKLLTNAKCLIGNSSTGIRECSFLGVPVVNIGDRQNGRLRSSNVVDVDYSVDRIVQSINRQLESGTYPRDDIYGDGYAGQRIADLLSEVCLSTKKQIHY